tara:strand:+ start:343 stop:537 length:195 start_codon:yes stop_codon:yes gene_type:complete
MTPELLKISLETALTLDFRIKRIQIEEITVKGENMSCNDADIILNNHRLIFFKTYRKEIGIPKY